MEYNENLPRWDALYVASNDAARAYESAIAKFKEIFEINYAKLDTINKKYILNRDAREQAVLDKAYELKTAISFIERIRANSDSFRDWIYDLMCKIIEEVKNFEELIKACFSMG